MTVRLCSYYLSLDPNTGYNARRKSKGRHRNALKINCGHTQIMVYIYLIVHTIADFQTRKGLKGS